MDVGRGGETFAQASFALVTNVTFQQTLYVSMFQLIQLQIWRKFFGQKIWVSKKNIKQRQNLAGHLRSKSWLYLFWDAGDVSYHRLLNICHLPYIVINCRLFWFSIFLNVFCNSILVCEGLNSDIVSCFDLSVVCCRLVCMYLLKM